MGLKKANAAVVEPITLKPIAVAPIAAPVVPAIENGTAAAVKRLQKSAEAPLKNKAYEDPSARGKTRCALFEAAIISPTLTGMKFDTIEAWLELCRKTAEYGVAYVFEELPK